MAPEHPLLTKLLDNQPVNLTPAQERIVEESLLELSEVLSMPLLDTIPVQALAALAVINTETTVTTADLIKEILIDSWNRGLIFDTLIAMQKINNQPRH